MLSKGGKDGKAKNKKREVTKNDSTKCFNCGGTVHVKKDCRAAGGGAADDNNKCYCGSMRVTKRWRQVRREGSHVLDVRWRGAH